MRDEGGVVLREAVHDRAAPVVAAEDDLWDVQLACEEGEVVAGAAGGVVRDGVGGCVL